MNKSIIQASKFEPKFNDKFFIDANVWLYLYFPQYSQKPQKFIEIYSTLFSKIIEKKCLIISHFQLFSELINRWQKIKYEVFLKSNSFIKFKEYRESEDGKKTLEELKYVINNILKISSVSSGDFNEEQLKVLINKCNIADVNDILFIDICRKNRLSLVTHDFDFFALENDFNIPIISANRNYFNNF